MKIYYVYDGEGGVREPYKASIKLPASWQAGPCNKVLSHFVAMYNKKYYPTGAETVVESKLGPLVETDYQLKIKDTFLPPDGIVSNFIQEYNDVEIIHRPKAVEEKFPEGSVVCTNFGCGKRFINDETGNLDGCCQYHEGKPVFHDTYKYWSCCPNKKALDWEEFEAIPKCKAGCHSTANPQISFQSEPISHQPLTQEQVKTTMSSNPAAVVSGGVHSGPREFEGGKHDSDTPGEIVDGMGKCRNHGCGQKFVVADNVLNESGVGPCLHHKGGPVFWDTYKYWACCPDKKRYEFDDFVKVPGCNQGLHKL